VGIEKPIALWLVVLSRYNKKMSTEEILPRYDRNQKDANVMVSGEVVNTAILVRRQEEDEPADRRTSLQRDLALGRKAYAPISDHEQLWGGIEIELSNIPGKLEELEKRQQMLLEQEKHDPQKARAAEDISLEIFRQWQKIQAQVLKNARSLIPSG
jgi:hypothetical protein